VPVRVTRSWLFWKKAVVGEPIDIEGNVLSLVKRGDVAHALVHSKGQLCLNVIAFNPQSKAFNAVVQLPFEHISNPREAYQFKIL
jgi:glutaminase